MLSGDQSDRNAPYNLSRLSRELLSAAAETSRNPRFREAVRVFARHYVDTFRGNRLLNKIATGEARHLLCGHMVALHYRRDKDDPQCGIVLHRLQEFARAHDLCSKNGVAALVCLLKHTRYLQPVRSDGDRRVMRLEPSDLAGDALRRFIVAFVKALDILNGDDSLQSRFERDKGLPQAIVANAIELYFDDCQLLDAVPQMRIFSGREAGYEILLRLWSMYDATRAMPDRKISFPYGLVAKSFGVSRAHVRRLIESAAREGYFELRAEGGRSVEICPSLVDVVETFLSLKFSLYQIAVNRVNAEKRGDSPGNSGGSPSAISGEQARASPMPEIPELLKAPGRTLMRGTKDLAFCLSVPFTGQDSFSRIIAAYKDVVSEMGGTLTIVDANWDPGRQCDQIASLVASRPDALFVLPTDPATISKAVQAAKAAGIPTLMCDSSAPGTIVHSTSMHNHFGMGAASADYICKRLKGKGKIAAIHLYSNEAWSARSDGMRFVLSGYPEIRIIAETAYSLTGSATPQQVVEKMLREHPDIDAIWSAWDGGAIGAAGAIRALGRSSIFATGIDGGNEAFEYIKGGSAFCFTVAQCFHEQVYWNVYYAHEVLAGRRSPRMIINPAYAIGERDLSRNVPDNYDRRGVADRLGWRRIP